MRYQAMRARHGHSLATTRAIGQVANVHGVLESLAIIAHQSRGMARIGATERAGSETPPFSPAVREDYER
jgi:hypothetical protein